jgi:hypothetical protein
VLRTRGSALIIGILSLPSSSLLLNHAGISQKNPRATPSVTPRSVKNCRKCVLEPQNFFIPTIHGRGRPRRRLWRTKENSMMLRKARRWAAALCRFRNHTAYLSVRGNDGWFNLSFLIIICTCQALLFLPFFHFSMILQSCFPQALCIVILPMPSS